MSWTWRDELDLAIYNWVRRFLRNIERRLPMSFGKIDRASMRWAKGVIEAENQ